jgi:hypothetical protein
MGNARWVATLSNGTVAVEKEGEFIIVEGERKPWFKLLQKLKSDGLWLTSLRLNIDGRKVHLPSINGGKFDSKPPLFYSISYQLDIEINGGIDRDEEGSVIQSHYIWLSAHYDNFIVSFINGLDDENNSWISITDPNSERAKAIEAQGVFSPIKPDITSSTLGS